MQSVFDAIKDRLPISEVLSAYITLTPSGTQLKARCPFHNERTASFSVSSERGLYYCFGCGAKGDIFTFVEQFEGIDRKGALKILAEKAGVPLTNTSSIKRESTDALFDILELTTTRYQHQLKRNPAALAYLEGRGVLPETIESFRIGYAPDEWRFVSSSLQDDKELAVAERAGLIKKTEKPARPHEGSGAGGGYYDRFRKRIIFPLTDSSGRVIGFSGRIFPNDPSTDRGQASPKYLNSPETELFQKSRMLFGFDKAKNVIRQKQFAIMVEGQFDTVLSHQYGFRNTIATSGTAVSDASVADPMANLTVLSRLTPNIFLAFDGDAAGQKALHHAALVSLRLGMNPKVVPVPSGIDPADFLGQHGAQAWKELLQQSNHFLLHQLKSIDSKGVSAHLLVQQIKERIFPFLIEVQSPIEQGKYIESIATELELSAPDIIRELALFTSTKTDTKHVERSDTSRADTVTIAERFQTLITQFPTEATETHKLAIKELSFDGTLFTIEAISDEKKPELTALIERDYGYLSSEDRDMVVAELAKHLVEQFYGSLQMDYARELKRAEQANNEAMIETLMSKLQQLNQRRHTDT